MKRLVYLAMLCTAVLAPRTALAQDEDGVERRTSLSLRPFNDMTIGVWHQFTPRLELGLQVGGRISEEEGEGDQDGERSAIFSIEPAAKLYGAARGDLRPYTYGSLFFNSQHSDFGDDLEVTTAALGASLGLGLEWSPVERVRIGGHAGVSAAITDGERTTFELGNPVPFDVQGWQANTFTSGITLYYSF